MRFSHILSNTCHDLRKFGSHWSTFQSSVLWLLALRDLHNYPHSIRLTTKTTFQPAGWRVGMVVCVTCPNVLFQRQSGASLSRCLISGDRYSAARGERFLEMYNLSCCSWWQQTPEQVLRGFYWKCIWKYESKSIKVSISNRKPVSLYMQMHLFPLWLRVGVSTPVFILYMLW